MANESYRLPPEARHPQQDDCPLSAFVGLWITWRSLRGPRCRVEGELLIRERVLSKGRREDAQRPVCEPDARATPIEQRVWPLHSDLPADRDYLAHAH